MFHVFLCAVLTLAVHSHCSYIRVQSQGQNNLLKYYENVPAVKKFQEYVRIDTSVTENIEKAATFWRRQAAELGLPFTVIRPAGLPICIITLRGSKPDLPSIMLNSHSDVVPAEPELWKYPPFSAHLDDQGNLYGRGVQDCKSTGIQYLEAIRTLLQRNITLERTMHVTIMPDEEVGGPRGMVAFIKTKEFKALNVGFALDEGAPSPTDDVMYAFYYDKRPWQMKFKVQGSGGHGSLLRNGSTIEQVRTLINTAMEFRDQQLEVMKSRPATDYGAHTSININMIQGGIAANVMPSSMSVVIDMRLAAEQNPSDFQSVIDSWMAKLGPDTQLEFLRKIDSSEVTPADDSNPFWVALRNTIESLNLKVLPIVCSGTTDMLYLRDLGIPAFGFTPTRNVDILAHDVDEYIPVETFLEGIGTYADLIQSLANTPDVKYKCTTLSYN